MHKVEYKYYFKIGGDKDKRRDRVPDNFKRRVDADYVDKQALAAQGDSLIESDKLEHPEDASMAAVEENDNVFNSLFALM